MPNVLHDLRVALRSLRRSPGFAAVTILTLALGIGATATVASVADHVLLRPLPYRDADRLVTLLESDGRGGQRLASYPTFQDWQRESGSFAGLSFVRGESALLKDPQGAERLLIGYVSPGHFTTMGASPMLGRTFASDEERTDAGNTVVLSHDFWLRRFGGDPAVLGKTLTLDIGTIVVIGVMPPGTTFPEWADVWRPIAAVAATSPALAQRTVRSDSRIVARLGDGVTPEQAAADMRRVARGIARAHPADAAGWTSVQLTPLRDDVVGDAAPMLLTLSAAVAFGLLIACVNIANLSFVRAAGRGREMAVRAALGASHTHIARQLLTESAVLGAAAGALGVMFTSVAMHALRAAAPRGLPRASELAVDGRVLGLVILLSLLTAALCGLAPAVHMLRTDIAGMLRGGRSIGARGPRGRRTQSVLTVAQFALAMVLLVGAGLLVQSFRRAQAVDVGLQPEGVLALRVLPPSPRYDSADAAATLYARLLAAARAVPGVESAAFVNHAPLGNAAMPTRVRIPGRATDTTGADGALYKTVSPDYLRVLRIPLVRGRWFTDADLTSAATGVVISEETATRFWPGGNPLGQSITVFKSSPARADVGAPVQAQVIGVTGSVRHFGMESDPVPEVFVPYTSEPWTHGVLLVRTSLPAAQVVPALRAAVLAVDPELPVTGTAQGTGIQPLSRAIDTLLATRRWTMGLVTAFAASALLLAALGIYGVTAHAVAQRVPEIGVRLALGATRGDVLRMVVGRGVMLAGAGVLLGLAGAFALTRFIASLLFGTSATSPAIFVLVPLLLTAVATLACWLPARRAARVDPAIALRAD